MARIWDINDINLSPLSSFTTPPHDPGPYKSLIKPLVSNCIESYHMGVCVGAGRALRGEPIPALHDQDKHTPHRSIILIRFKGFWGVYSRGAQQRVLGVPHPILWCLTRIGSLNKTFLCHVSPLKWEKINTGMRSDEAWENIMPCLRSVSLIETQSITFHLINLNLYFPVQRPSQKYVFDQNGWEEFCGHHQRPHASVSIRRGTRCEPLSLISVGNYTLFLT